MKCTVCGAKTKITDSRETRFGTRRRHVCVIAGHKFSTLAIEVEYKGKHNNLYAGRERHAKMRLVPKGFSREARDPRKPVDPDQGYKLRVTFV